MTAACPRCGQPHPKGCVGHVDECTNPACLWRGSNHAGQPCTKCGGPVQERPCRKHPRRGTHVCANHGGSAPQVVKSGARRLALGAAEIAIDHERALGHALPTEPADAMLAMVQESAWNVAVYRHLVQQLPTDQLSVLKASPTSGNEAMPHIWVSMYDAEREKLVKWSKACRDSGVDERRIQLAEQQGAQLATVLRGTAAALLTLVLQLVGDRVPHRELEDAWQARWPGIVREQVQALNVAEVA